MQVPIYLPFSLFLEKVEDKLSYILRCINTNRESNLTCIEISLYKNLAKTKLVGVEDVFASLTFRATNLVQFLLSVTNPSLSETINTHPQSDLRKN